MDKNQLPPLQQASIFDVRAMSEAERASLGYLVLVMRRWPQGFSWEALNLQLWLPDAGPSPELLKAYQANMDLSEMAELCSKPCTIPSARGEPSSGTRIR
jgi:uncharacterized protein YeaO (DUF488 family)